MRVGGALDRLTRWVQRDGLLVGQRVGLRDVEYRHRTKHSSGRLLTLALRLPLTCVPVAVADAHRGEDADRALALADAPVQLQERPEPGNVGGVRSLHRDQ